MLQVDAVKMPQLVGVSDVLKESTLSIKMEGELVMEETGTDLLLGLACLMAVYVYRIRYPRQATKILTFIERHLLDLQDSALPLPVGRFIHLLDAL